MSRDHGRLPSEVRSDLTRSASAQTGSDPTRHWLIYPIRSDRPRITPASQGALVESGADPPGPQVGSDAVTQSVCLASITTEETSSAIGAQIRGGGTTQARMGAPRLNRVVAVL